MSKRDITDITIDLDDFELPARISNKIRREGRSMSLHHKWNDEEQRQRGQKRRRRDRTLPQWD